MPPRAPPFILAVIIDNCDKDSPFALYCFNWTEKFKKSVWYEISKSKGNLRA